MNVNEKVKSIIRNWLNVKEGNKNNMILLNDEDNIQVSLFKNELWYRGVVSELQQFYEQYDDMAGNTMFWHGRSTTGINFRKIHTGLPALIIDKLVDIVVDDLNSIDIYSGVDAEGEPVLNVEAMDRWESISKEHDFNDKTLKEAVKWALLGEAVFKISYDKDVSEFPIIEVIPGKNADYEYKRGRLMNAKFYFPKTIDKKPYVLEETYQKDGVLYKLYDENGKEVTNPLIEDLYGLYPFHYKDELLMAIPFMFAESTRYPGRGKGILEGKEGAFDSYDESWSQWMDAFRSGKPVTYIPDNLVPKNPLNGKPLEPNSYDRRYIKIGNDNRENGSNKISVEAPDIKSDNYLSNYITSLDNSLQGIISPSTLGIDVKKLDNAEAQREKEKTTLYTRGKMIKKLEKIIPQLVELVLKVDDRLNERTDGNYKVTVEFGEYANPSFEATIETVSKAKSVGIMSTEQAVEELYGNTWSKEEKAEEVSRLKKENGLGVTEPGVNEFDDDPNNLNLEDMDV